MLGRTQHMFNITVKVRRVGSRHISMEAAHPTIQDPKFDPSLGVFFERNMPRSVSGGLKLVRFGQVKSKTPSRGEGQMPRT